MSYVPICILPLKSSPFAFLDFDTPTHQLKHLLECSKEIVAIHFLVSSLFDVSLNALNNFQNLASVQGQFLDFEEGEKQ